MLGKQRCWPSCYLDKNWGSFWWVPKELHSVKLSRVSPGVDYADWHGDICNGSMQNKLLSNEFLKYTIFYIGTLLSCHEFTIQVNSQFPQLILWESFWIVIRHTVLHSNIISIQESNNQNLSRHLCLCQRSPRSRMRSPGLFQRQPSSCWCSVYWSRRSWNTTRIILWNEEKFKGCCKWYLYHLTLFHTGKYIVNHILTFTILPVISGSSPIFRLSSILIS